jgi:hypothetical protein
MAGAYSIIRFCPNVARGEGVNVGVVVVSPEHGSVVLRMSENNERVKTMFRATAYDDRRLASAKVALATRLRQIAPTEQGLQQFIAREAGHFVITWPQPMVVTESLQTDVNLLFDELVGETSPRHRLRLDAPDIDRFFEPLAHERIPLRRNVEVEVPGLKKKLRAPWSYDNSKRHYIRPEAFHADEISAIDLASDLGKKGLLISKHKDLTTNLPQALVVVGSFQRDELRAPIGDLLKDFNVRLVPNNELPAYVEEVRAHAHVVN